jgi:phage FluMu protein Com
MEISSENNYQDYRCETCHKLLFKGTLIKGEVEIKCKGCKNLNKFIGEKE